MKKTNLQKKGKGKLILGIVILIFLMILIVLSFKKNRDTDESLDYKLGIIADDGIKLVSVSKERRMINELNLDDKVSVWIPEGMSWYNNTKVKNMLEQEKKINLAKNLFWYNFGFFPDKILVLDSVDQWQNDGVLIKNLGFFSWLKFRISYGKMLLKQEMMTTEDLENGLFLDEIMVRDFSESRVNNEDLRISVFNSTDQMGLANFMAKRLEWAGFSVVSTDNTNEKVDNCLVVYGNKVDLNYGWKLINRIFDCEKKFNESLNENEMEIYFGGNLASVIKYSTYVRTF